MKPASFNRLQLRPSLRILRIPLKNRLQVRFRVGLAADGCEAFGVGQFDLVAFSALLLQPIAPQIDRDVRRPAGEQSNFVRGRIQRAGFRKIS
jgi:hypothetical protein